MTASSARVVPTVVEVVAQRSDRGLDGRGGGGQGQGGAVGGERGDERREVGIGREQAVDGGEAGQRLALVNRTRSGPGPGWSARC